MEKTTCYFCGAQCGSLPKLGDYDGYNCEYCGMYKISYTTLSTKNDVLKSNKHIFAGYLEETKDTRNKDFTITSERIEAILNDSKVPKTTMKKLEKLLLYCDERNEYFGQEFTTDISYIEQAKAFAKDRYYLNGIAARIGIAYTKDTNELNGVINGMNEFGWIRAEYSLREHNLMCFTLTAKGLQHAEQLLTTNVDSNKVFVAIEYHNKYEERFGVIYTACEECGFDAFLSEDVEHNKSVMDEMIAGIKQSKFIIADLTHDNSGAYYEAGYAKGLGREVIKCCSQAWLDEDDKNKVHFDLAGDSIIFYDNLPDLKKQLKSRIRATIDGAKPAD